MLKKPILCCIEGGGVRQIENATGAMTALMYASIMVQMVITLMLDHKAGMKPQSFSIPDLL